MSTDSSEPRGRRRRAAKTPVQPAAKVKLTVRVDAATAERFRLHALMTGKEQCDLFADLVQTHCRRFVVHDRDKGPGETSEAGAA
jgi:hypothetical protein